MTRVLVTGGAGFVGSHTVDALVVRGDEVVIFDSLDPQVHPGGKTPDYLNPDAELIRGDVRDVDALRAALSGVQAVIHLAAAVGVGQSMYEVRRYVEINSLGGANLLQLLVDEDHQVGRVVVASSMSIFGEGAYECASCGPVEANSRTDEQLERHEWEPKCDGCGKALQSVPTPESKRLQPTSIYAVTKRDHEEMFLFTGRPPIIYEDGQQSRDFIHVSDIVQANLLALDGHHIADRVYNVGTGRPTTVLQVGETMAQLLGSEARLNVIGRYRAGDIRHCFADISSLRDELGFEPCVTFTDGMGQLVKWLHSQSAEDGVESAQAELQRRGLVS